jgi:hypothetical protein
MFYLNTEIMEWILLKNEDHTTLPAPRNSHSSVYSQRNECFILFGGANETVGPMNDVWLFSLKNYEQDHSWEQLICDGDCHPSPREMHSACMDENRNCMYIIGGRDIEGNVCNDLWALNFGTKNFLFCFATIVLTHIISHVPAPFSF